MPEVKGLMRFANGVLSRGTQGSEDIRSPGELQTYRRVPWGPVVRVVVLVTLGMTVYEILKTTLLQPLDRLAIPPHDHHREHLGLGDNCLLPDPQAGKINCVEKE